MFDLSKFSSIMDGIDDTYEDDEDEYTGEDYEDASDEDDGSDDFSLYLDMLEEDEFCEVGNMVADKVEANMDVSTVNKIQFHISNIAENRSISAI
jgi:hypothetical protein